MGTARKLAGCESHWLDESAVKDSWVRTVGSRRLPLPPSCRSSSQFSSYDPSAPYATLEIHLIFPALELEITMARMKRAQRPKDELKRELVEQLQLLRHSCQAFDNGLEAVAKHISLSLRVLLHHHGQSRALLDQLGLRDGRYLTSASTLNPRNLLTECNLILMRADATGARYLPLIAAGALPFPLQGIPFVNWWNDPVLKDNRGRTFCRRELVLNVADTDGGAHVDPELEEAYMAISRENSLGWVFSTAAGASALEGRPELACMRQIAHELLSTIHQFAPEFSQHAEPAVPKNTPQGTHLSSHPC